MNDQYKSIINAAPLSVDLGVSTVTTINTAQLKADMVFNNPTTGAEMVRISSDGFYVHGKKLEQPETEARELYDAMMKWCNVRL